MASRAQARSREGLKRGPFADLTNTVASAAAAAGLVKPRRREAYAVYEEPVSEEPVYVQDRGWLRGLDEADRGHADDPQQVAEYVADIMAHLRERQGATKAKEGYMASVQREVTERMRAILVDWLVEVHQKFSLRPETLFLAVSLLDRYLSEKPVARSKLQLVGVTCLLLAAKYEEVYPPEVRDVVNITDKEYTRAQVLEMEVSICNTLGFKLVTSTAYAFLQRYVAVMQYGRTHAYLAQYALELTLIDYALLRHDPSHLASAALYLANKIMRVDEPWPARLKAHTRATDVSLRPCAREMCSLVQGASKASLQAVRKKFSSDKMDAVAKLLTLPRENVY